MVEGSHRGSGRIHPSRSGTCSLPSVLLAVHSVLSLGFAQDAGRDGGGELGELLRNAGEPKKHFVGVDPSGLAQKRIADANYAILRYESFRGRWFAALVSDEPANKFDILQRFSTVEDMEAWFQIRGAVVEVWAYGPGGSPGRRLTARELSERASTGNAPPTFLTARFLDPESGRVKSTRLEFGAFAASATARATQDYSDQRRRRREMRRALSARGTAGELSAAAQWAALQAAVSRGVLRARALPPESRVKDDLFVAWEWEVGTSGRLTRVVRVYRASEISHRIMRIMGGSDVLLLKSSGGKGARTAVSMKQDGEAGQPIAGRDAIEVRVRDPDEADPRRWNVLEFGEPWVLRESGLAQLGLITAHLENQRKEVAWRKSNLDRFAEPLFAGLNVWGGITGAGTPWGEAARLAYNVLVTRALTPDVPTAAELEDLFRYVAAKAQHPRLAGKPGNTLSAAEVAELRRVGGQLSARQVEDALQTIRSDDIEAMRSFAQWQNVDQKYRLFVDILSDTLKVTGDSETGILKDVFNNSRLTPSGELSITTTLAAALGQRGVTPLSGTSLEQLVSGDGPPEAWLQFLNLTVDLRAVANTLSLLRHRASEDRELRKPFGHAPRLNDLSAFEFRIFGYPSLFWYKRGLLADDLEAYRKEFAYSIYGTKIVERFPTRQSFNALLREGRLRPIGFARIPTGLRRTQRESNLPVFAHLIEDGKHAGKTAILIYGLKAFREHAATMSRELARFREYERMMTEGGVITKLLEAENGEDLPPVEFEPTLQVGEEAVARHFKPLLEDLLEFQRLVRFRQWGLPFDDSEMESFRSLEARLRGRGVEIAAAGREPLERVDPYFSSFVYRARVEGRWRRIQVIHIPSVRELARGMVAAEYRRQEEAKRRRAAGRPQMIP